MVLRCATIVTNAGKLTEGVADRLLTKAAVHTRGIKVRLVDGQVGRVHEIVADGSPCASG